MNINLSPQLLSAIVKKNVHDSSIKILSASSKQSIIEFRGVKINVPFFLDKNEKYTAVLKKNKIFIKKIGQAENLHNIITHKNKESDLLSTSLKKFFDIKDNYDNNLLKLFIPFIKIDKNLEKYINDNAKKNFFVNNNKKKSFAFYFNIMLFNRKSKLYLVLNNNRIDINIYSELFSDESLQKDLSVLLNSNFDKKDKKKLIFFFNSIEHFKEKIYYDISVNNIDLIV